MFSECIFRTCKSLIKPMEKALFQKSKHDCENLIKPMEFEAFLRPKAEKCSKMIGKALPREGFRVAFSRTPKTWWNQWKMNFSTCRKFLSKYLIKTNGIGALFEPKSEKVLQKTLEKHCLQKLFAWCDRQVEKPYKTNGKLYILSPPSWPPADCIL